MINKTSKQIKILNVIAFQGVVGGIVSKTRPFYGLVCLVRMRSAVQFRLAAPKSTSLGKCFFFFVDKKETLDYSIIT